MTSKKYLDLKSKTVNITPLFEKCDIETGHLEIAETIGMYPYKEKIEDNWAYFTTVGMKQLKYILDSEGKIAKKIGIVGIGSGIEGMAAIYVFRDTLKELVVTDIDDKILQGTVLNIAHATNGTNVEVIPLLGSFCEPIEEAGYMVDVVHANVPNLPAQGDEDLTQGAEKGTFLPAQLYDSYDPPEKFVGWALGAQYAYLQSAKKVVESGGTIITELGGRVPMNVVRELFTACDLELQEVVNGFKEQTEALIYFIGYNRMEKKYGVSFEFYRFEESLALLSEKGIENPTTKITADELKRILEPYKVTAEEAIGLYHQNIAVGHTVHLFRGMKKLRQ